jgi:hypothetical protein
MLQPKKALTNIFYGVKKGVRLRAMCCITKTGCSHVAKGDQCVEDAGFQWLQPWLQATAPSAPN